MKLGTLLSVVSLLVILAVPFILRPYAVNGQSMETTLTSGDVVLVDALSLKLIGLERGELLVFRNPHRKKEGDHTEVDIKRIVGLPGETVHVRLDTVVIGRNCGAAGEPAAPQRVDIQPQDGPCQTTYASSTVLGGGSFGNNTNEFDMFLGPEDYFVLGDNRADSSDSRLFGTVQPENFIGRPLLRALPLSRLGILD